jgi:hypothetical protein
MENWSPTLLHPADDNGTPQIITALGVKPAGKEIV